MMSPKGRALPPERNTGNPNCQFYGQAIIGEGNKTYLPPVHTGKEALSSVHLSGNPCFPPRISRSFKMRAIGYENPQSIDAATALVDIDLPRPEPTGRDILDDFPHWEPAHKIMMGAGIPGIENIGGDVDLVTGKRCTIMAFPWRWPQGEGCGVRVIAVIDPDQKFRIETGR